MRQQLGPFVLCVEDFPENGKYVWQVDLDPTQWYSSELMLTGDNSGEASTHDAAIRAGVTAAMGLETIFRNMIQMDKTPMPRNADMICAHCGALVREDPNQPGVFVRGQTSLCLANTKTFRHECAVSVAPD